MGSLQPGSCTSVRALPGRALRSCRWLPRSRPGALKTTDRMACVAQAFVITCWAKNRSASELSSTGRGSSSRCHCA